MGTRHARLVEFARAGTLARLGWKYWAHLWLAPALFGLLRVLVKWNCSCTVREEKRAEIGPKLADSVPRPTCAQYPRAVGVSRSNIGAASSAA